MQLVNKVNMERITLFMRNHESAFWKKGMFFDGELRSSVRILPWSKNLPGFHCCATPIIMTSMPKFAKYRVGTNYFICENRESVFSKKIMFFSMPVQKFWRRSCENQGRKTFLLSSLLSSFHSKHTASYTDYHLLDLTWWWILEYLASEKFVLARE